MLKIRSYTEMDKDEIIALVLHCQNDGSRPYVTIEDQPELLCITEKYIQAGGNFWVAENDGKIAGCIGLMNLGKQVAVLKKFFVYEPYRSSPHHLGQRLYQELMKYARNTGIKLLVLDTPGNAHRAHKFYEAAGFHKIDVEQLPIQYDYPYKDCDFYCLALD